MNKESSAVLVHTCVVDENRPELPDTVGRQSALAAAELYRQDRENTHIVITAGEYSQGGPDLGENMADHIRRLLRAETNSELNNHITVTSTARDTRGEISEFKSLVEENGWKSLYDLGPQPHYSRRERAVNRIMPGQIPTENILNAEEVLMNINPRRYMNAVNLVQRSPKYQSFAVWNKYIDIIDRVPFGETILNIAGKVVSNEAKEKLGNSITKIRSLITH